MFEGTGGAPNGGGDGNGLSQQCGAGAGAPGTVVAEAETDAPEGKGGQSNIFGRGEPTVSIGWGVVKVWFEVKGVWSASIRYLGPSPAQYLTWDLAQPFTMSIVYFLPGS